MVCVHICCRGCCPTRKRRTRKSYRKSASWYPLSFPDPHEKDTAHGVTCDQGTLNSKPPPVYCTVITRSLVVYWQRHTMPECANQELIYIYGALVYYGITVSQTHRLLCTMWSCPHNLNLTQWSSLACFVFEEKRRAGQKMNNSGGVSFTDVLFSGCQEG